VSESANALRDNDTRLAELARDISAAQWAKPSLCTEWTNHEVLAHLVIGYGVALSAVTASMLRHRGAFDAANTDLARSLAAHRASCSTTFWRWRGVPGESAASFRSGCCWGTTSSMNSTSRTRWAKSRRYPCRPSSLSSTPRCGYPTRSSRRRREPAVSICLPPMPTGVIAPMALR
jgi:hypothetical protein